MPRHVRVLYREDLLDAAPQLPGGGRLPEGPLRRSLAGGLRQQGQQPGITPGRPTAPAAREPGPQTALRS